MNISNFSPLSFLLIIMLCVMRVRDVFTCSTDYSCNPSSPTRCYKVYKDLQKHDAAASVCTNENAHLVMIESVTTNSFVQTLMDNSGMSTFHLGLDDKDTEGTYIWTLTGEPVSWSNWNSNGQKNNNGLNCVKLEKDYGWTWSAVTCNKKISFICDCSDPNHLEAPSSSVVTSSMLYSSEQYNAIVPESSSMFIDDTQLVTSILSVNPTSLETTSLPFTSILSQSSSVLDSTQQLSYISTQISTMISYFTEQPSDSLTQTSTIVSDSTQQSTNILLQSSTIMQLSTLQTTAILLEDSTIVPDSTQQTSDILLHSSTIIQNSTEQTTDILLEASTIIQHSTHLLDMLLHTTIVSDSTQQTTDSLSEQIIVSVSQQSSYDHMESSALYSEDSTASSTDVVTAGVSTVSPKNCTRCKCRVKQDGFFGNQSLEEILTHLQELVTATVQRKRANRKTSAVDPRISSTVIGSGAIVILTVVVTVVVAVDIPNLFRMIHILKKNVINNTINP